jgi:hypothetical protein
MNRVEIKGTNEVTGIRLDGFRLSAATIELRMEPGYVPHVTVGLPIVNDDLVAEVDARVHLDEQTHAALIAMGWTPPDGD